MLTVPRKSKVFSSIRRLFYIFHSWKIFMSLQSVAAFEAFYENDIFHKSDLFTFIFVLTFTFPVVYCASSAWLYASLHLHVCLLVCSFSFRDGDGDGASTATRIHHDLYPYIIHTLIYDFWCCLFWSCLQFVFVSCMFSLLCKY